MIRAVSRAVRADKHNSARSVKCHQGEHDVIATASHCPGIWGEVTVKCVTLSGTLRIR
jgi:hypothetical protein